MGISVAERLLQPNLLDHRAKMLLQKDVLVGFNPEDYKHGSRYDTASDAWFDVMMSFITEKSALDDYLELFSQLPDKDRYDFAELRRKWLELEYAFFLTEKGCGHFLSIQPTYPYTIERDAEEGLLVCPADLRQLGDQSTRYVRANGTVGEGLLKIYRYMDEVGIGAVTAVMSPSELYKEYNSDTDVLNFQWVYGEDDAGKKLAAGKYIVLGKKLTEEQRYFVHNYLVLRRTNPSVVFENVPTDRLFSAADLRSMSYQEALVRDPAAFQLREVEGDEGGAAIMALVHSLDSLFKKRFGVTLIEPDDLTMYPVVHALVDRHIDRLTELLGDTRNREAYYTEMRKMFFTCQAIWKSLQPAEEIYAEHDRHVVVVDHLSMIVHNQFFVGFEMGMGGGLLTEYSPRGYMEHNPMSTLLGYSELEKYCKKHEKPYSGTQCPQCIELKNDAHVG